ncbi:hypothetical protein DFH09DRAFT_1390295 [Mycena vulgaris]|nr:hypothetical protein DFH09DRAFT_1390295 [Mycena vulgaris]
MPSLFSRAAQRRRRPSTRPSRRPPFPLSRRCLGRTNSGGPGATASRTPPPSASYPLPSRRSRTLRRGGSPPPRAAYGLLSPARHAVLGLPDAARLVTRACAEFERTGVASPFAFSALELDVRRTAVERLVHAFLAACADGAGSREEGRWAEEARLAGAHDVS